MSEDRIQRVTFNTIALDESYQPRAGLEYELGDGIVGVLKPPYEGLIEEYDRLREEEGFEAKSEDELGEMSPEEKRDYYRSRGKENRTLTYKLTALVLDFGDDEFDLLDNRKKCIWPVVDRASEDFFIIKNPKPSEHMRSYMEEVQKVAEEMGRRPSESQKNGSVAFENSEADRASGS